MATKILTGQGHSAQWPIIGTEPDANYHDPGKELVDGEIKMTEATVNVDEILVAHLDVPFKDEAISHFSVIQPFAERLGRSLAVNLDKKLAILGVKAARTDGVSGVHSGGNRVFRDDGAGASKQASRPHTRTTPLVRAASVMTLPTWRD